MTEVSVSAQVGGHALGSSTLRAPSGGRNEGLAPVGRPLDARRPKVAPGVWGLWSCGERVVEEAAWVVDCRAGANEGSLRSERTSRAM